MDLSVIIYASIHVHVCIINPRANIMWLQHTYCLLYVLLDKQ